MDGAVVDVEKLRALVKTGKTLDLKAAVATIKS